MELFLFLFFLVFFGLVVAVFTYYMKILFFSAKSNYRREELTEIRGDVLRIFLNLLESNGNILYGSLTFLGTAIFVWVWSLLGSVLGEKGPGIFEHIFHLPIFFLALFFSYPIIKEAYQGTSILGLTKPALSGLALGNLSSGAVHYGLDRDLYFLFYLLLFFLQAPVLVFLWNQESILGVSFEPTPSYESNTDWENETEGQGEERFPMDPINEEDNPFAEESEPYGLGDDPFSDEFK
ncbi:hypothetical protein LEP1GSC202_3751 [Leptospira yanagawae serovar Saopaulo str. Sao Paulo = ATCC 700523]|uniref:Uncharacterized protein n=1 Tax=Leptospira yanagawae serovar Saopaulo str. Sao Paulo = ATCC 700523 TaxID=1249483 RepID=A0A5E8HJI6_9LEPT|nr:hypothetical protein [Leptospira yanagawae]EOQ90660.1 hypothetical protein LEP1GSC202_3751 [Leptospira yanagawae serovar Saopaulo str. Sao Paulo = ATCC 700523]